MEEKELVFKIDGEELEKLRQWQENIKGVYGQYGNFEYRFSCGSGIGVEIKVYSELAKIELDFIYIIKSK
jgi:hypothetical protein